MASAETSPSAPVGNDHGGTNASTKIMDSIFGGLKGQPRDDLGRFARQATRAPPSEARYEEGSSTGQKRALEHSEEMDIQEERKRPALESAAAALERTLDNDSPVAVDPETFKQYNAQESELKSAMERIKALEEEKAKWEDLGRATGTRDIEGAKRIVERATDEYAQGEVSKIKEAINYLHDLAGRIDGPAGAEWKAHVETTGKRMEGLASNKEEILSENYLKNSQPIVSAMVAASYDIQRQVGQAKTEAEDWKSKYEEERSARMRLEAHVNVLERGNRSATSSWSVHASRDSPAPLSAPASSSGFGLPASSAASGGRSSLFSAPPASSSGGGGSRASFSSSSMFTAASSTPLTSASSSGTSPATMGGIASTSKADPSTASGGGPLPAAGSAMFQQQTSHHAHFDFDNPMDALSAGLDPRMADAMALTKQRRAHMYGAPDDAKIIGRNQVESAKALKSADILPEDMREWGRTFGRTQILTPVVGNTIFT